jgi:hypothetical protein
MLRNNHLDSLKIMFDYDQANLLEWITNCKDILLSINYLKNNKIDLAKKYIDKLLTIKKITMNF